MSVFIMMSLMLATGCMKNTYVQKGNPGPVAAIEKEWQLYFVAGLVPLDNSFDLKKACPAGVAKIETGTSFLNGLASVLSSNIVTPRYAKIYCKGGTSHTLELKVDTRVSKLH